MYGMDQSKYDAASPDGFQTAEFLLQHGQLDIVVKDEKELMEVLNKLMKTMKPVNINAAADMISEEKVDEIKKIAEKFAQTSIMKPNYLQTREMDRYIYMSI